MLCAVLSISLSAFAHHRKLKYMRTVLILCEELSSKDVLAEIVDYHNGSPDILMKRANVPSSYCKKFIVDLV